MVRKIQRGNHLRHSRNTEMVRVVFTLGALFGAVPAVQAQAGAAGFEAGVAKIDITPTYPVRLSGFGSRRTESEGITERIWARALALRDATGEPAVLVAVDNLGIPWAMTQKVAARLAE